MSNANNSSDSSTTIFDLKKVVEQFVAERNWQQFHNLKNLSMSLAIEAAELMEHAQWLTSTQVESKESIDLPAVTEELADVLSYVLAIANTLDIDLAQAVNNKMVKNRVKYPVETADQTFQKL